MDSPENTTTTTTTATNATTETASATVTALSDSPRVPESPFSNYISNLSPIKPVKAALVAQRLLGFGSPPTVFTSPRTTSDRAANLLQRFQCPGKSGEDISNSNNGSKKSADSPDDLGKSPTFLSSRLIGDGQKTDNVNNSAEGQPGSSSGCADEYLSDPLDVDCAVSVNFVNPNLEASGDAIQSSESNLTHLETVVQKSDYRNDKERKEGVSHAMPEQDAEDTKEQSTSGTKTTNSEEGGSSSKQPSQDCPKFESGLPRDHTSRQEQCDVSEAQVACPDEDYAKDVGTVLQGRVQLITHLDPQAIQLQRGMSRRCLQFEEAQQKITERGSHSSNAAIDIIDSISPASTTEVEILGSSRLELTISSSKMQTMNSMFHANKSGKSPLDVSKPSGIGLHLNSIVNTLPVGCSATMSIKSEPITSHHLVENKISCSKQSNLVKRVSFIVDDGELQTKDSHAASSATSEAFCTMEHLNIWQPHEHQVSLHNKRILSSRHAENFEDCNQLSPKKKRKKVSSTVGDGCKRCNCKKTKCLKLYCDCFAAGIYCAESCACQGCFNRPEYEDTVLEMRQQIESRNPLAFAPKIVQYQHVTEVQAINPEDVGLFTSPPSGRHKTGCNCKRSLCMKNYCECYQANVGCSNACRCEGCRNIHGRKAENGMAEEIVSNRANEERLESMAEDKLEMVANNKFLHPELYDLLSLTPPTPSFESSSHGKDAPKSRLLPGRYVLSSESDLSMLPSYGQSVRSPSNSPGNDMLPDASKETLDIVSYSKQLDDNITEIMGQFSPRLNELADISDHTPLPNPSSIMMVSSASSKTWKKASASQFQLYHGSGRLSSGSSLCLNSSPITPGIRLGETKNQARDSDVGVYDILEDDTPRILKESPSTTTSVKATSPNKKRISPPHIHTQDLRSSSSAGLQSGRKFILKSVPAFPPLTPCVDSKGSTQEKQ